jgi:2'-5' RNA ligase
MRTFIAIEMPAAVRDLLADLQQRLDRTLNDAHAGNRVRWTTSQNLHLTLRFLGETSDGLRPIVERELASRLQRQPAFALGLHQLGSFPHWRRPAIVWVDFTGATGQLASVQALVETAARTAGFAAEERPFTPHLTIGRVKKDVTAREQQQLGEVLQQVQARSATLLAAPAAQFTVDAVAFVQSDLRPTGPVYTTLTSYSLKG